MKSKQTCFILYFVSMVISVNVHGKFIGNPLRTKRQSDDPNDDRWIWGYYTPNEPSAAPRQAPNLEAEKELITTTEQTTTTTEIVQTPCTQQAPVKPDFSAPGRRISEQKCFEYIFDIRYRQEAARIKKECKDYVESSGRTYYEIKPLVVGGTNAAPGEYPHMVAVGWPTFAEFSYVFKCGGTLISDQFVLTAGHCTKSGPDTTLTNLVPTMVALGDRQLVTVENGYFSYLRGIDEIIPHPQYKSPNQYYDIALIKMKLRQPFNSAVHPACLWPHFDTLILGTQAAVTGWGVVDITNRTTSPILQQAIIDMVDSGTCDSLLKSRCNRKWCGIQDTQICAGKLAGGVDACQGDSGGPLQMKINLPTTNASMYYVIGVTSFGFGCAIPDIPGVYTRVSAFVDWIEGIVWP